MNNRKYIAVGVVVGFVLGVGAGQLIPKTEAGAAPVVASPASQPAPQDEAHGMPAEGDACGMDCAKERPELEARLAKNPKDIEALIALGACDLDMGNPQQGVERLSQAVMLSTDAKQLVEAGIALAKSAESEKAFAAFEKALVEKPKDSEALYRAGLLAFHNLGDKKRAVSYWTRYLAVAPDAPNAEIIKRAVEQLSKEEQGG